MKIISRGQTPDLKPIRFECTHCKTVFEATQQETTFVPDQRDGNFWQVACPVCARLVTKAVKS